jgi:hypothetical protein
VPTNVQIVNIVAEDIDFGKKPVGKDPITRDIVVAPANVSRLKMENVLNALARPEPEGLAIVPIPMAAALNNINHASPSYPWDLGINDLII